MRKVLPFFACVFAIASVSAERQSIERYGGLIERQMFGPLPLGFDPSKMPNEVARTSSKEEKELAQEEEKIKKAIRFSVLNVTPDGQTIVGFSDNGDPKNALHYYLKVGESQNGWTVRSADPEAATMTIEKDGIEVTLKLGGDSATDTDSVNRVGGATQRGEGRMNSSLRERRRLKEERREEESAKRQQELMNEIQAMREERRRDREEREAREAAEAEKNAAKENTTESESTVE